MNYRSSFLFLAAPPPMAAVLCCFKGGYIFVNTADNNVTKRIKRKQILLVEEFGLYPGLSGQYHLRALGGNLTANPEAMNSAMAFINFEGQLNDKVSANSLGMKQQPAPSAFRWGERLCCCHEIRFFASINWIFPYCCHLHLDASVIK